MVEKPEKFDNPLVSFENENSNQIGIEARSSFPEPVSNFNNVRFFRRYNPRGYGASANMLKNFYRLFLQVKVYFLKEKIKCTNDKRFIKMNFLPLYYPETIDFSIFSTLKKHFT